MMFRIGFIVVVCLLMHQLQAQTGSREAIDKMVKKIDSGSYSEHEEKKGDRLDIYFVGLTRKELFKVQSITGPALTNYYFFGNRLIKITCLDNQDRPRSVRATIYFLPDESPSSWNEEKRDHYARAEEFLRIYPSLQ
jgi:hypothetical protein